MPSPTALMTANWSSSRTGAAVRRRRNVHCRLPYQATQVATATETTLAVRGLSPSTSPGPNRSRLNSPASTTNATAPDHPELDHLADQHVQRAAHPVEHALDEPERCHASSSLLVV